MTSISGNNQVTLASIFRMIEAKVDADMMEEEPLEFWDSDAEEYV